jgi:uncharacterized protein (TIGR03435 family)
MRHAGFVLLAIVFGVVTTRAQNPPRSFEAASVKTVEPLDMQRVLDGSQARPGTTITPSRVDIVGAPLGALITAAFKVKPTEVSGPSWLNLDPVAQLRSGERRFDIRATLPPGTAADDIPEMLRALLIERFKLAFHRERRDQQVYALVVGPGGPKLKATPPPAAPPGVPATNRRPAVSSVNGVVRIEQEGVSMTQLANVLTGVVGRQVIDRTQLSGTYTVKLELAAADLNVSGGAAAAGVSPEQLRNAAASDPGGGGSALRSIEALGLKMEPRTITADQIVVDRVEPLPLPD